jgi:growth arrest-specific protein 8
VAGEAGTA